jgi:hypothetical protein
MRLRLMLVAWRGVAWRGVQFWIPAKDFRLSEDKDPDTIRTEAQEIVEKYIKESSDCQVNINGATRKDILTALKGPVTRYTAHHTAPALCMLMFVSHALVSRSSFTATCSRKLRRKCWRS